MKTAVFGLFAVLSLWLTSCGNAYNISEEEFNSTQWKNDPKGCAGRRIELKKNLRAIEDKLKTLRERDIRIILGKPDQVDLYRRNQKFYIYFTDPGSQCPDGDPSTKAGYISVRFDAVSKVNEILFISTSTLQTGN